MSLTGKGFYIWIVKQCENGDPDRIASLARTANLSHVLVKVADGAFPYNVDLETNYDYARPVIETLRSRGIQVWGWQYVYGDYPVQEAEIAVKRAVELGLDGYVVNAEGEYQNPRKEAAAIRYMNILRNNLGGMPLALSSYRYPSYHADFPWRAFLDRCDYNMPQVYWLKSHNNAGSQLQRCVNEFRQMQPFRPIIPTGPTFKQDGWIPYETEMIEFMQVALDLGLPGVNFWNWDSCRKYMTHFWDLIKAFPYGTEIPVKEMPERYIEALNTGSPEDVLALYHENAVHIRAEQAVKGKEAIRLWIASLINKVQQNGYFRLLGATLNNHAYHFNWQASTNTDDLLMQGQDTIGLVDGKITYHYSFINTDALI